MELHQQSSDGPIARRNRLDADCGIDNSRAGNSELTLGEFQDDLVKASHFVKRFVIFCSASKHGLLHLFLSTREHIAEECSSSFLFAVDFSYDLLSYH